MKQDLKLAWRNLFRNPRRSLASLLTIAFGSCGILIYQGFNEGIMNQYRENTIRVRYGHGQIYQKGYLDKVSEEPWRLWIEDFDSLDKTLKTIPHVKELYPRISFYGFMSHGGINLAGRGEGVLPERENSFFTQMNFISGENLKSDDGIILGTGLAQSLNLKVGDTLTLLTQTIHGQMNGADLQVEGIFHTGKKDFDDSGFRVSLGQAQSLLDTSLVEHVAIQSEGVEFWKDIEKNIEAKLSSLDAISFDELDKVYYRNAVDFMDRQFQFIRAIILFIVALGIFNIIAVGMLERAPETGALRANGETRKRLWSLYLMEASFLGALGGLLGIVIAYILNFTLLKDGILMPPAPGITRQYYVFVEIQSHHTVQAFLLPVLATLVSSLFPIHSLLKKKIPQLLGSH